MRKLTATAVALLLFPTLSATAAITGTIIDPAGAPIAGVTVRAFAVETIRERTARIMAGNLDRDPVGSAQTAANGTFRIDKLTVPVVDVVASVAGRETISRFTADGDEIVLMLRDVKPRKMRVVAGGKPVANAIVSVSRAVAVRTGTDGTFELPSASIRTVGVYHRDYAPLDVPVTRNDSDIKLDTGVPLTGVVNGADGKPVAGATLWISNWQLARAGDDGTFAIAHAPRGWRELYAIASDRIDVATHGKASAYTLKLRPGVKVTGTVRDDKSHAAVAGMLLRLPFGETMTDAAGSFTFSPAVTGRFAFSASHPLYTIGNNGMLSIGPDGAKEAIAATMLPLLSGSVIDEEKKAVAGAWVGRGTMFPGNETSSTFTLRDGSFSFRAGTGLESFRPMPFEVSKDGYVDSQFTAPDGQSKSGISIMLRHGIPLSIRVVDTAKAPVSGALVRVSATERDSGPPRMARCNGEDCITGADGRVILSVAQGKYDITVWSNAAVTRALPAQLVDARSAPITVVVERGVDVSGRVTYTDGTPITTPVRVTLESGGAVPITITTEADGTFVFHNSPRGAITVRPEVFESSRYIGAPKEVTAPAANVTLTIPRGGRISGRVLDASSGAPVTDFELLVQRTVASFAGGSPRTVHADDGAFTVEDVTPGRVELTAVASGYTRGSASGIEVPEGSSVPNVELRLEKAARVKGRVTSSDGNALSGVRVGASGSGRRVGMLDFTSTDADGNYELNTVEPGDRNISFLKEGFVAATKSVETTAGRDARLDVSLERGRELTGRVVDDSGQPVAAADIRVQGQEIRPVQTDDGGAFHLTGLREGHVGLIAHKNGFVDGHGEADTAAPAGVTLTLSRGATISGHITGLTEGEVAAANVAFYGNGSFGSTRPDAAGNFTLTGVHDGKVTVEASTGMQSRRSARKLVEVLNGTAPAVELVFTAGSTVKGRVLAPGRTLADFNISFNPIDPSQPPGNSRVDSDGNYSAIGLGTGEYRIVLMAPMLGAVYSEKYRVSGDSVHDIDLHTLVLQGRVTDTDGVPVADAHVAADVVKRESGSPMPRSAMTDSAGHYIIDFLAEGEWRVSVQKEKYQGATKEAQVGQSSPPLDFQLSRATRTTVRVTDQRDGSPVLAVVNAVQGGKQVYSAQTGASDGVAELYLAPGHYTINVYAQHLARATSQLDVPGPEVRVSLAAGATIMVNAKPGMRVRLTGAAMAMFTASNRFDNVPAGHYVVQLLGSDNKVAESKPVDVLEGQTVTVTFE